MLRALTLLRITIRDLNGLWINIRNRFCAPVTSTSAIKTLAEDATQETFLRVYRTIDSFRGESSEKTWILKIAMHTCYDINHSGWFRFMNRHVTPEMLPDQSANTIIDRDEELAAAVMKLPRKLREAILLHYYQGLNNNEIADALNISHSSVSGRLKRGREKLKNLLEGRELDE